MKVYIDYSALLGKIVEVFGTQYNFALAIGLSERTISLKLNNHIPWKSTEIISALSILGIPSSEVEKYFFKQKVQANELSEPQTTRQKEAV